MDGIVTSGTVSEFVTSLADSAPRVDERTGVTVTVDRVTDSNQLGGAIAAVAYRAFVKGSDESACVVLRVVSHVEPWVTLSDGLNHADEAPAVGEDTIHKRLLSSAYYECLQDVLDPLLRIGVPEPSPVLRRVIESDDRVSFLGPTQALPLIVPRPPR